MKSRSWLPLVVLVFAIGLVAANLALHGADATGWRAALRATARCSLFVFLGVYLGAALAQLWPASWSRGLRERYPDLVLALAASHGVHFVAIVALAVVDWTGFVPRLGGGVVVGALAYASLGLMALSPSRGPDAPVHRAGHHLIWLAFIGTLLTRTERTPLELTLAALLVIAAALRAAAWWRARRAVAA